MSDTTFAFGLNALDGCECPAISAGNDLKNWAQYRIAGMYDSILVGRIGERRGTVPEGVAKAAWFEAIAQAEDDECESAARIGREIADDLGWMAEGEEQ